MDFMNENQAAHGDREFGHIFTRLHKNRKVIMGYWEDKETQERIGDWMRTAVGVIESSHVRVMLSLIHIYGNFLIAYNKKVGFKHRMFISYIRCSFCKY